jgi:hypothetical protein
VLEDCLFDEVRIFSHHRNVSIFIELFTDLNKCLNNTKTGGGHRETNEL